MKEFYYHEDFYGQVELLPVAALESSRSEMDKINAFSAAHWDGTGWTDIYIRQDQAQPLRSLSIPINRLSAALDPLLEPVDEVYTGYSTHRELCKNTRGWLLPCRTAILADYNSAGVVEHIWIIDEPPEPENLNLMQQALQRLNQYGELFIADWNRSLAVPCGDDEKLRDYLSGIAEADG